MHMGARDVSGPVAEIWAGLPAGWTAEYAHEAHLKWCADGDEDEGEGDDEVPPSDPSRGARVDDKALHARGAGWRGQALACEPPLVPPDLLGDGGHARILVLAEVERIRRGLVARRATREMAWRHGQLGCVPDGSGQRRIGVRERRVRRRCL